MSILKKSADMLILPMPISLHCQGPTNGIFNCRCLTSCNHWGVTNLFIMWKIHVEIKLSLLCGIPIHLWWQVHIDTIVSLLECSVYPQDTLQYAIVSYKSRPPVAALLHLMYLYTASFYFSVMISKTCKILEMATSRIFDTKPLE